MAPDAKPLIRGVWPAPARSNASTADATSWIVAPLVLGLGVPLIGALGPNTLFFTAHGLSAWVWLATALVILIVTWCAVFLILRVLKRQLSVRAWDTSAAGVTLVVWGFCAFSVLARLLLDALWPLALALGLIIGAAVTLIARRVRLGSVLLGCAVVAACVPMVNPLFGTTPVAKAATINSSNPPTVVWVVADELQYPLIFDAQGAVRPQYPNLRALQGTATTYARAFTPANYTDFAMPALFNGVTDVGGLTAADRADMKASRGIFPALSTAYSVVMESPLFRFECNATNCVNASPDAGASITDQVRLLIADSTAVLGRVAMAPVIAAAFPSLDGKWRDFWSSGEDPAGSVLAIPAQRFIDSMNAAKASSQAPVLGLWHTMRTHAPWTVDSAGAQWYPRRLPVVPGSHMVGTDANGHYTSKETIELSRRIYAASAVEFDRQVGILMSDMKKAGTFNDTMIIVTADHGVAFTERKDRRLGDTDVQMWSEVAHVPLLVKYPQQDKPEVVTAVRSTAQISQTILDTVGAANTDLVLAPGLAQDLPKPPVFTNVAGGAMTRWTYDPGVQLTDPWSPATLEDPDRLRPYAIGIDDALLGKKVPATWHQASGVDVRLLPGESDQMVVVVDRPASTCSDDPALLAEDGVVVGSVLWGRDDVSASSALDAGTEQVQRGWAIVPRAEESAVSLWCAKN